MGLEPSVEIKNLHLAINKKKAKYLGYPLEKRMDRTKLLPTLSQGEESALHLFFKCQFTQRAWARISEILHFSSFWDGSTLLECFNHWNNTQHLLGTLPPYICWFVWIERNRSIFYGVFPSTSSVTFKALSLFPGWNFIHKRKKSLKLRRKTEISEGLPTRWFDDTALANGLNCGAGVTFRLQKTLSFFGF